MNNTSPEISVLSQYGINNPSIQAIGTGLINQTWLVSNKDKKYILQQVNSMFDEGIHEDIYKVISYLNNNGIQLPALICNQDKNLFSRHGNTVWRLYQYIDGVTFDIVTKGEIAYEAGLILGNFHRVLNTLDYQFSSTRPGVHDTQRHLKILKDALNNQHDHPRYNEIKPLAIQILEKANELPTLPPTTMRKVHGDPKINNFLFNEDSQRGICILDYDTLSEMQITLELGDAMRSWCNPCGEDEPDSCFLLEHFQAGMEGYQQSSDGLLSQAECESILPAILTIYIELAARFCADALNENYFAWNDKRFSSHSEHSQIRAMSQLNAGESLLSQYKNAKNI